MGFHLEKMNTRKPCINKMMEQVENAYLLIAVIIAQRMGLKSHIKVLIRVE